MGKSVRPQTPEHRQRRARLDRWRALQDCLGDASLSAILILEGSIIFLTGPLAAKGFPLVDRVVDILIWTTVTLVVLLSRRLGPSIAIFAGLALMSTKFWPFAWWSPTVANILSGGGTVLEFSALTWVVATAVFAPGRVTSQRLQGAAVIYLNLALIFSAIYLLIYEFDPSAFYNVHGRAVDTMLYFSLTTLTTTGYGDISPVDPFARGLANLEQVVGQFYLTITIARLVALQIAERTSEG